MRFCPNNDCEYYGWLARGNICSNGHPNSGKWRQLKCIVCGTYFIEVQGTIFYRSKASPDKIILALKIMSEGLGIQSTARALGLDANTVQDWLKQGAEHWQYNQHIICGADEPDTASSCASSGKTHHTDCQDSIGIGAAVIPDRRIL